MYGQRIALLVFSLLAFGLSASGFANSQKIVTINAKVFVFEPVSQSISASGKVSVYFGDTTLTGRTGNYRKKAQTIELEGDVQLIRNEVTLTCDTMTAFLEKDAVQAKGGVNVTYLDYSGHSERVYFDGVKNLAILTGSPLLLHRDDQITAEEITIDIEKKKIRTKGRTKINVKQ